MAELSNEKILRPNEQTAQKKSDVVHLLSNATTRSISRVVIEHTPKTQLQGELFMDIDEYTGERRIYTGDKNGIVLTIKGDLTPKDHALLDCILVEFTEQVDFNNIDANAKNFNIEALPIKILTIDLPIEKVMQRGGKDEDYISNNNNFRQFKNREIAPSIKNLFEMSAKGETSEGDFDGMHLFSRLKVVGHNIHAELGKDCAKHFLNHRDTQKMLFDTRLIELAYNNKGKSRAKQIAYILGKKLYEHACMPNNIKNSEKGYFALSVKNAIDAVKFCLNKDIKSPVKEIITPLFEALEILTDRKIIDYCFCGKNKHRLNTAETDKVLSDYATFLSSFICFKVINFNTEETKQRLIAEKIINIEKRKKGRPRIDHNKVYENPK